VVGHCDPSEDHAEISDKIESYLWLKLSQIEFDIDETSPDALSLERFQKLLYEDYGMFADQGGMFSFVCLLLFLLLQTPMCVRDVLFSALSVCFFLSLFVIRFLKN
jgi:hypothetical protein